MVFDKERFREAMGDISIVDLADKLGCPKSSISMYLSGQREPSKMAAQLIALNLGVNPAWLAGLDVPKYSNAKIISKTNNPAASGDGLEEDGKSHYSDIQQKLIDLFPEMTDSEISVLLATAQAQISSHKHTDAG